MAFGPGKYDDLCTEVRKKAKADGAIVIVFGGEQGMGFSVQAPPDILVGLPVFLRVIADSIEEDLTNDLTNFAN